MRYAVIDFETSGLAPGGGGRALEIAAVLVEGGQILGSYQSLINPGVHVPSWITELTGITQSMVSKAPSPDKVMAEVADFVGDAVMVAHNAGFDSKFWQYELERIGLVPPMDFLCTVLLSRRLYPWAPNHKLQTLVELHGITQQGRYHRALADAQVTAEVFLQMLRDLEELYPDDVCDFGFMAHYQKTSRHKLRSVSAPARGLR